MTRSRGAAAERRTDLTDVADHGSAEGQEFNADIRRQQLDVWEST